MTATIGKKIPKVIDGKLLLKFQPSGIDTDGVLILKMMKPGDEGEGGFNVGEVSLQVEPITNLLGAIIKTKIMVNIEEDPRIKAWCIASRYKGIFVTFIKHSPLIIPVYDWLMNRNSVGYGEHYDDETDTLGPTHRTWEPKVLDFSSSGKNEVGMVKGKEDLEDFTWKYYSIEPTVWEQGGYDDDPEWRTFYDVDDFAYEPKMFGDDLPSTVSGTSLLDKVNAARFSNSLLPINGHSGMMIVAQNHADYMASIGDLANFYAGSHEKEIAETSLDFEFEEYGRLIYSYRESLSAGINMEEIYDKAMKHWLADPAMSEILLRNGYNAAGFGESEIKLHQEFGNKVDYTVFISLDLAVLSSIGTSTDEIFSSEEGVKFEVDYTQDMEDPKFAINSYNPLCKAFGVYDRNPIPSDIYMLFGFYNDKSVLTPEDRLIANDPLDYPILLATIEATYNNLKAGTIIEVSENSEGNARYKVKMPSGEVEEEVKGLSIAKFPVGRWVVIQGPGIISSALEGHDVVLNSGWRIVPSSSKYYKNVQQHGSGIS